MEEAAQKSRGVRIGRYELLQRIAAGGMGEVFIARAAGDESIQARVALKLLLPHLSSDARFVRRFLDEARIAARMGHPNIVPIFDVGEADGRYYIGMALVDGPPLSRVIKACLQRGERVPLPVVRAVGAGLCEGLAYAHALTDPQGRPLGIIHRDVTPSNVLLSYGGAVMLTDFGLARAADNLHRSRTGELQGTWAYMAPERLQAGRQLDARSDLYSAAVVLWELTSLAPLFRRDDDVTTLEAVRAGVVPQLRELRDDVTPGIVEALTTALRREPKDRWARAGDMRAALVDGPVASAEELGQWLRRAAPQEPAQDQGWGGGTAVLASGLASGPSRPARPRVWRAAAGVGALLVVALPLGAVLWRGSSEPEPLVAAQLPTVATPSQPVAPATAQVARVEVAAPAAVRPGERVQRTERARRSTEPAALKIGYLTVNVDPWAVLYVDGKEMSATPLARFPVEAGSHRLEFRNPRYPQPLRRKVQIEPGQEVRLDLRF